MAYLPFLQRKAWLVKTLSDEVEKLSNKARFLQEVTSGNLTVNNQMKSVLIDLLRAREYLEIPDAEDHGFDYLLGMPIWSLTVERMEKLLRERDTKAEELRILQQQTEKDLWRRDLQEFSTYWEQALQPGPVDKKGKSSRKIAVPKGSRGISTSTVQKSEGRSKEGIYQQFPFLPFASAQIYQTNSCEKDSAIHARPLADFKPIFSRGYIGCICTVPYRV